MNIAIRELGITDQIMIEEALDACSPGWVDASAPGAASSVAFLADSHTFMLVGYVDNEPAGFLWGVHVRSPLGELRSWCSDLRVRDQFQRHGVASTLVEASLSVCRRRGSELFTVPGSTAGAEGRAVVALCEHLDGTRAGGPAAPAYSWELR